MTKSELIDALNQLNIPKNVYSIDEVNNETLCIIKEFDGWVIFYSEKGNRTGPEYFYDEDLAYRTFLFEVQDMLNHL